MGLSLKMKLPGIGFFVRPRWLKVYTLLNPTISGPKGEAPNRFRDVIEPAARVIENRSVSVESFLDPILL